MKETEDFIKDRMKSPFTDKEWTEKELLLLISEDVGRLSKIESTLEEEGEHLTLYNRIMGIELRTYETVNVLFSIKRLLWAVVSLLVLISIILLSE